MLDGDHYRTAELVNQLMKPYSYIYPCDLHSEIFKPMNTKSTELDKHFEYRNDHRYSGGLFNHFQVLILCIISGLAVLGIILTAIFGETIDSIKPEVQLIIFAVAMAVLGVVRAIVWFRKLY